MRTPARPWSDPRGWGLTADRTAWYPSATLYRQAARGDRSAALDRMAADLGRLLGG